MAVVNPLKVGSDGLVAQFGATDTLPVSKVTNGVPTGGATNHVLTKNSASDYDMTWKESWMYDAGIYFALSNGESGARGARIYRVKKDSTTLYSRAVIDPSRVFSTGYYYLFVGIEASAGTDPSPHTYKLDNQGFVIGVKGAGPIVVTMPDGTATGGNERGSGAIDLQRWREEEINVASGYDSFIGNGWDNQASGVSSFVGSGYQNTASGEVSWVAGGNGASTLGIFSARAWSSAYRSVRGDNQVIGYHARATTTSASAAYLTPADMGLSSQTVVPLFNYSAAMFRIWLVAMKSDGTAARYWQINGLIRRGANAAATTLVTSATVDSGGDASLAGLTPEVYADTTYGGLTLAGFGLASTTVHWSADVQLVTVG